MERDMERPTRDEAPHLSLNRLSSAKNVAKALKKKVKAKKISRQEKEIAAKEEVKRLEMLEKATKAAGGKGGKKKKNPLKKGGRGGKGKGGKGKGRGKKGKPEKKQQDGVSNPDSDQGKDRPAPQKVKGQQTPRAPSTKESEQ